jgi:glycosyltransferase involved in cell wall biosynthesis
MKLSIIIPAFNESKLLASTLASVREAREAVHRAGWSSEVIVCDNNSTDGTAEIARANGADAVVFEPVNQIGRARNAGAAAATGHWFLFIDADSNPSYGLLSAMMDEILSGRVLAGGSTVTMNSMDPRARLGATAWNMVSRLGRLIAGSFLFVEAGVFRELGGFDCRFYAGEELDFVKRLRPAARRSGKKIVIIASAPLLTSDRKLHLYSPFEILSLLVRAAFRPWKTLTDKRSCELWYDGRR